MAEITTAPETFRLFIANLPFAWDDAQLKEAFADTNAVSATVVRHGRRSMGYGFVDYSTKEEADKIVESHNGKEFDGRKIVVQFAKERIPREQKDPVEGEASNEDGKEPRRRRARRRPDRQPRVEFPPECTIFVSNLSFKIDDEALGKIFEKDGLTVVSSRVATGPRRKSKGFGFVQFASAEQQLKAISEFNLRTVEDREITVAATTQKPREKVEEPVDAPAE